MGRLTHRLELFLASKRGKRILNRFYSWGAAFVILGALFKLLHIRYGDLILLVSMLTEFVVFFISGFEKPEQSYAWEQVFPELAGSEPLTQGEIQAQREKLRFRLSQTDGEGQAPSLPASSPAEEGAIDRLSEAIDRLQEAIAQLSRIGGLSSDASKAYEQFTDPVAVAKHTSDYADQLGALARNVTGLNALYELQLKSISSQIDTIDRINAGLRAQAELYTGSDPAQPSLRTENQHLLLQLQQLNEAYARMLQALNVQVGLTPPSPSVR